jgi:signal recognition particle receptor subunit beta
MVSGHCDVSAESVLAAFKIVVAGGFGAGKTTLVGAVSEVQPLHTEEALSRAGIGVDDPAEGKTTTTVAMDFGRITINEHLVLYLFGTPGQERFWFMWDELSYGAIGAVILADTRRLNDCFPSVDYFEKCGLPFVIAINAFGDAPRYDAEDVRIALDLGPAVPIMFCDARQPASVKEVLITLVEHVLATSPVQPAPAVSATAPPPADPPASLWPDVPPEPTYQEPSYQQQPDRPDEPPSPRAAGFFGAPTAPAAEERWPAGMAWSER